MDTPKKNSCHGLSGRRARAKSQVLPDQISQDTSPRVNLDPKNSHEHPCHGLSGWGANPYALPNQISPDTSPRVNLEPKNSHEHLCHDLSGWGAQRSQAQTPGVKLDAYQMNSCQGVCGGRTGANHKSSPTTEAKAQAQGLIWRTSTGKGNLISKITPFWANLWEMASQNKRHVAQTDPKTGPKSR